MKKSIKPVRRPIKKRRLSNRDANTVVETGRAVVKRGLGTLLTAVATGMPTSGALTLLGASLVPEFVDILSKLEGERLNEFVGDFWLKSADLPAEARHRLQLQLQTDEGIELAEQAMREAIAGVDPAKRDLIAATLKNSLSSDELQTHHAKWLLKLLADLDMAQIVILQSFSPKNIGSREFRQHHQAIFEDSEPPQLNQFVPTGFYPSLYWENKPVKEELKAQLKEEKEAYQKELAEYRKQEAGIVLKFKIALERHALYQSRVDALVEKGLLGATSVFPRSKNGISEALTPLGASLLKITDSMKHTEFAYGVQINAIEAIRHSHEMAEESRLGAIEDEARLFR